MRAVVLALGLASSASAQGQPYSHSMAQCSALTYVMSQMITDADRAYWLNEMSEVWFAAALDRAAVDQIDSAFETLTNIANDTEAEFLSKGRTWVFSGEFKDWTVYCRSLDEHLGLDIAKGE